MIKAIILAATVPFMTQHRAVAPSTMVSTNFYGSVTGIVDQAYIEAHGGGGGGGGSSMTTNIVSAIADNRITNSVLAGYLAQPSVTNGLAKAATTLSGYGITDAYTKEEIDGTTVTNLGAVVAATNAAKAYADATFRTKTDNVCHANTLSVWKNVPSGYHMHVHDGYAWSLSPIGREDESMFKGDLDSTSITWEPDEWLGGYEVTVTRSNIATSGKTFVTEDNVPSTNGFIIAPTATNIAEAVNATTRAIVATWENFLDGSNVVFSITNYISGIYNLDTAKLRIMEMTNGVYREVYNSRDEILMHINDFKNTDFRVATNQVIQGVSAAIADKADKAWGRYTSTGGTAPSNTVYLTEPNTVFAGGLEYERVAVGEGSICVLTTKGAPVYTVGDEGTFKFQDDGGTNFFGFAKTDSYVIGADFSGIVVGNDHVVQLSFDITMSGVPCIWYKSTLDNYSQTMWEQLNLPDGTSIPGASHNVTWEQNPPAGKEICYINVGNEPYGFFRATVEVAGQAKFITNMPSDFTGGILCTDRIHKVSIDWNGGNPRFVEVQ